jgi:dipeptidyl-peptidase-4
MGNAFGKSLRQLAIAVVLIALAGAYREVAAQRTPAESIAIANIAGEREQRNAMPGKFSWAPDGKTLGFIRTTPIPGKIPHPSMTAEIWSINSITGLQMRLVSYAEITAAFSGKQPQALSAEESDDSRSSVLQNYLWSPDGHTLLLTSGKSIAWFNLGTRKSLPLVTGQKDIGNPQISPDGRLVSFIEEHTLRLVNAATGDAQTFATGGDSELREGEPDWVYSHELGMPSAYWWSPDSSSIAWIETDDRAVSKYMLRNSKGDEHSISYPKPGGTIPVVRLFVQAVAGNKPLRIDLGGSVNQYIPRVQWLPDGKHIAIERLSRDQKTLDLLLADATTGKTRTILTEKDSYWINLSGDLYFFKDSSRFAWFSERSGYRHIYLYDLSGHQLSQLTQGNWEVTSLVGVDETAGVIYFSATESTPLERQLYRVNLDGSGLTRITKEKGTHELLSSPGGNVFLDNWSNHVTPPRQELLRTDGSKIAALNEEVPEGQTKNLLASVEFLTLKSHLGIDLNAWMIKPPDFNSAKQYPVILYVAGGPGEQIVRDAWGGDISQWLALMARKGYVVFAVDNRGSAGRGHLFEEPLHLRFSATEMADQRDGVQYLRSLPWVDKTRIGICGWGYGGFLALHGMLDRPLLFKAGFAGSPITDWHLYDAVFAERYLGDPERNQDGWLSSSPLENARNLNAPLLLAQATMDETVHQENSLMLLDELLDHGKYADILLFPDRRNLFEDYGERLVLFQRLTDFYVKNL